MKKTLTVLFVVLMAAILFVSCDSDANAPEAKAGGYSIGDKGPAGGYIFYVNPNYEEGSTDEAKNWKYLEAAPADLESQYEFGKYSTDGGSTLAVVGTETGVGTGKSNTEALVKAIGDSQTYAAKGCSDYSITVEGVVYDDWFLPSKDELKLMYTNLKAAGKGGTWQDDFYWSSSEFDSNHEYNTDFEDGGERTDPNFSDRYVRPVRYSK